MLLVCCFVFDGLSDIRMWFALNNGGFVFHAAMINLLHSSVSVGHQRVVLSCAGFVCWFVGF